MIDEDDPQIGIELTVLPSNKGELHTVGIGFTEFPTILIKSEMNEAEDGIVFRIITGQPYEQDESAEVGGLLTLLGKAIQSEEFQTRWAIEALAPADEDEDDDDLIDEDEDYDE